MLKYKIPQIVTLTRVSPQKGHLKVTVYKNQALTNICKCLILSVDQPGLEPGTSRL